MDTRTTKIVVVRQSAINTTNEKETWIRNRVNIHSQQTRKWAATAKPHFVNTAQQPHGKRRVNENCDINWPCIGLL